MAAEGEGQLDALRPSGAPLVIEARCRDAGVGLEGDIAQCVAPPEGQGLV